MGASDTLGNDAMSEDGPSRPSIARPTNVARNRFTFVKNKIRVLNARALFKALKINIFRLQLCIPLDYLEQLALDFQDAKNARTTTPEIVPEGSDMSISTADATAELLTHAVATLQDSSAPIALQQRNGKEDEAVCSRNYLEGEKINADTSSFACTSSQLIGPRHSYTPDTSGVDGDEDDDHVHTSAQPVTEAAVAGVIEPATVGGDNHDHQQRKISRPGAMSLRQMLPKGSSPSFKSSSSWKRDGFSKNMNLFKTSVSVKQLQRHQSSRKSISAVIARNMQNDDSRDSKSAGTPQKLLSAGDNLSHDDNTAHCETLPVERMLGTAMVHAFLGMNSILSKQDLTMQSTQASNMPWQMPCDRPFSW
eukprot:gene1135-1694_t